MTGCGRWRAVRDVVIYILFDVNVIELCLATDQCFSAILDQEGWVTISDGQRNCQVWTGGGGVAFRHQMMKLK